MKILEDIRVLDLTQFWFGPFCTMMLADMGAEVIRVEPPWGSPDRVADAYIVGSSSYTFHQLNLNKKGLTLNLKTPEGMRVFKELVPLSDVVVQNFRPGTMERLASFSPRLIDSLMEHMGVEEVTMEAIQERVSQMTRDEAVQYFVDAKVPVAPVYNIDDVVRDPHLHSRDMFVEVDHRAAGKVKVVNFPVKFSETPCEVRDAAPALGQHDEDLLRNILGYDESKIDELKKANAIME